MPAGTRIGPYEILSLRRRPFQGASIATLLSAILRDTPPPLRAARQDLPRSLEEIAGRCLRKDPEQRFGSTSELHAALEGCLRELGTPHGLRMSRRGLVAAAAMVAVAGGVAAWLEFGDDFGRWMARDTLTEIDRLSDEERVYEAFRLARQVQERLPGDPEVRKRIERITLPIVIATEPPGAEVHIKGYATPPDAPWVPLGETPLVNVRVPYALSHWRITKEGLRRSKARPSGNGPSRRLRRGSFPTRRAPGRPTWSASREVHSPGSAFRPSCLPTTGSIGTRSPTGSSRRFSTPGATTRPNTGRSPS